ncbi:MAG: DNA-directed RNA polymerase subunit omega [Acidobacteriota bacterium]
MMQLPENFDSIFRYIEVVSQRAEQIIRGARPRTEARAAKPTLQARDDVDGGTVEWRILTQEELDAQRQAMVEQFRAEMESVEEAAAEGAAAPDVLPTSGGEAPALDPGALGAPEEIDDELQKLQQLLGMAGATIPDITEGESAEDTSAEVVVESDASTADDATDDEVDEKD